MKYVFLFLFISFSAIAQVRTEKPLPLFPKKAVKVLDDNVLGWSYSLDGQWVSAEKKIPVRLVSRDEDEYDKNRNELGSDNFSDFQLYPVIYGADTLIALVKIYDNGSYKYKGLKDGWEKRQDAHYFLFSKSSLKDLKNLETGHIQLTKIPLLDDGHLKDIKKSKLVSNLEASVVVDKQYSRHLVLTSQVFEDTDTGTDNNSIQKIRFQVFSTSRLSSDLEGVVSDFQLRGKSLYGSPELFNYLYYECDRSLYDAFFTLEDQ